MVPPFGFRKRERIVLGLFVLSGVAGLILFPLGLLNSLGTGRQYLRIAEACLWSPGKPFLFFQGLLVMFSACGAVCRSLTIVAAGILAGLVFVTPIGVLTVLPAAGVLFLALPRLNAFREFMPRGGPNIYFRNTRK